MDVILKKSGAVHNIPKELESTFILGESVESSNILYVQARSPVLVKTRATCLELGTARYVEIEVRPALSDANGVRLRGGRLRKHPEYWTCSFLVSVPLGRVVNFVKVERLLGGFCVWILVSGSEQMAVTLHEIKLTTEL